MLVTVQFSLSSPDFTRDLAEEVRRVVNRAVDAAIPDLLTDDDAFVGVRQITDSRGLSIGLVRVDNE